MKTKKYIKILILILSINMYSQNNFKILSLADLSELELKNKDKISQSYIVEHNKAFATIFNDGSSILRPPVLGGNKGFLFSNHEDMIEMIKTKQYPTNNDAMFWEREKQSVKEIDSFILNSCQRLSILFNTEFKISNDSPYLLKLSEVINAKYKSIKKSNKDLDYYLAIYIGETIRQNNSAEWKLLPKYGFEIYYLPEIVKDSTFCSPWGFILGQLEMISFIPIDIATLIIESNNFYSFNKDRYISN